MNSNTRDAGEPSELVSREQQKQMLMLGFPECLLGSQLLGVVDRGVSGEIQSVPT